MLCKVLDLLLMAEKGCSADIAAVNMPLSKCRSVIGIKILVEASGSKSHTHTQKKLSLKFKLMNNQKKKNSHVVATKSEG